MRNSIQLVFLVTFALTILLCGCASVSTPVSSTITPTSTVTPATTVIPLSTVKPANTDLITTSGFQFRISKVTLDDAVKLFESYGADTASDTVGPDFITHKSGLIFTPGGNIPVNATGDAVLILYIKLISGDKQKFLEFEPKIIEGGVTKSAVEVVTQNNGVGFFWIYDVKKSSHFSFLLKLPNQTTLDLQPILRLNPPAIPNP